MSAQSRRHRRARPEPPGTDDAVRDRVDSAAGVGPDGAPYSYDTPAQDTDAARAPRLDAEALVYDPDTPLLAAVVARERTGGSWPDPASVAAMEEPIHRLLGAATLLGDLAIARDPDIPIEHRSVGFLATALRREAARLFHLYHGKSPDRPRPCR